LNSELGKIWKHMLYT